MTEILFRALVNRLNAVVAPIRDRYQGTQRLMPDDDDLLRNLRVALQEIRDRDAPGVNEDILWILVGLLLYGPPFDPGDPHELSRARFMKVKSYVSRWRRGRVGDHGTVVIRGEHILQLVFVYALGVRRPVGRATARISGEVVSETTAQAAAWGEANWGMAIMTLHRFLACQARELFTQLREMGLRNLCLVPPEPMAGRVEAWQDDREAAAGIVHHSTHVLLGFPGPDGRPRCGCLTFLAAHPGAGAAVERRHRQQHELAGWLDKCWPWSTRRNYDEGPYPIRAFLIRATRGDHPHHAHTFEYGFWFTALRSGGDPLATIQLLACRECQTHPAAGDTDAATDTPTPDEPNCRLARISAGDADPGPAGGCHSCNGHLSSFEECLRCHRPTPLNHLIYWVVREGDPGFFRDQARVCDRCGRLVPVEQAENEEPCACGSAGMGFSPIVGGEKTCENPECGATLAGDVAVCPHCGNAGYSSRDSNIYFRRRPGGADPNAVPHRGRGRNRAPVIPRPAPPAVEEEADGDESQVNTPGRTPDQQGTPGSDQTRETE